MSERTEIEYALTVNIEDAADKIKQLERLFFRVLGIIQRMGLPDDVNKAISTIRKLIATLRMLQISISLIASTNPVTAAFGIVGLVGTAVEFGSGSILEGY